MSRLADETPGYVTCTMRPDESVSEFIARAAAAHGPLSDVEIVRLRAIFQTVDAEPAPPVITLPEAA